MRTKRLLWLTVALASILLVACGGGQQTAAILPTSTSSVQTPAAHVETATPVPTATTLERPIGIFVVNADGSGLRQVWDGDAVAHSWSPDGRVIAFADRLAPTHDVMLLDLQSGAVRNLGPSYYSAIEWSPDGTRVLVDVPDEADSSGTVPFLEIADLATGQRERVTEGIYGKWSPDGRRISFSGPTCERLGDLRIYDLATGHIEPVGPADRAAVDIAPDWTRAAYFKTQPGTVTPDYTVYVGALDGSDEIILPTAPLGKGSIVWSPNGDWIIYNAVTGDNVYDRRPNLLASDGSGSPTPIADHGDAYEWSPDSSAVVITDAEGILVFSLRDRSARRVWRGVAYHVEWSPDGSRLAFASPRAGEDRADLYVYDAASGDARKLTQEPVYVARPHWSPDGQRIAFLAIGGGYGYGLCE
jgi:Tol biopolymer transport system component